MLGGRRRKRRVVVMHSNALYDDDAASKHHHTQQQHHPYPQQQQQLMPPRVKVETLPACRSSRRRRSLLSTVLEYEIPLDPQWELPRDKSVSRTDDLFLFYPAD